MDRNAGASLPVRNADVRQAYQAFFNWSELPFFDDQDPWYDRDSSIVRGVLTKLDKSDGKGCWEIAQLSEHMLIRINNTSYHSNYKVPKSLLSVDLVTIRFVVLGEILSSANSNDEFVSQNQTVTITLNSSGDELQHEIVAGKKLISTSLFFPRQALVKLLGSSLNSISSPLRESIQNGGMKNRLFQVEMNSSMINAVIDLASMPYTGKIRYMYAKAKINELFCLLLHKFQLRSEIKNDFRAGDVERLQKAQALLIKDISKPMSVSCLAKLVGVNRTKLETGFKQLYGSTVYDFYHQHRMQKAKQLLEDGGSSISQVAEAIGYEHPGNFTFAFKKFYGVLPKSIKRHSLI